MRETKAEFLFCSKLMIIVWMVISYAFVSCIDPSSHTEQVQKMISAAIAAEDTDAVMALDLYEEAYDVLCQYPDSDLESEVHYRMGLLFLRNGLAEECIECMTSAFVLDSVQRDTMGMLRELGYIAFAYETRGHIEAARGTLSRVVDDLGNSPLQVHRDLQTDYYDRYLNMQEMKNQLPEEEFDKLEHLTPKSGELDLVVRGWNAERDSQLWDAIGWYRKLSNKRSSYVRSFALLRMAKLQIQMGQHIEATRTIESYEQVNAQIRKREQVTKRLLQHHAHYQDRRSQEKIGRLSLLSHRQGVALIWGAVVSLLVVGILLLVVRLYRQRQIILKFRIEKMRQWREEYLQRGEQQRKSLEEVASSSDIYRQLRLRVNGGDASHITAEQWQAIEQAVLQAYPSFKNRLYDLCRLSEHDYHVCLLLKMGFRPTDIAFLTIRSDEAISSTRRRLFERAFGRKGSPKEWDDVLKTL